MLKEKIFFSSWKKPFLLLLLPSREDLGSDLNVTENTRGRTRGGR